MAVNFLIQFTNSRTTEEKSWLSYMSIATIGLLVVLNYSYQIYNIILQRKENKHKERLEKHRFDERIKAINNVLSPDYLAQPDAKASL